MQNHELTIVLLNLCIMSFSYFWLYPRVAGANLKKVTRYDLVSSVVAVILSGFLYAGQAYEFNLFVTATNWLWFSLVTYIVLETPFMLWYMKRYDLFG